MAESFKKLKLDIDDYLLGISFKHDSDRSKMRSLFIEFAATIDSLEERIKDLEKKVETLQDWSPR